MRECCTPCVVQYADWVYFFQSNAPRAGCNRGTPPRQAACRISINAPHAGCDGGGFCLQGQVRYFNLMHPMRGATKGCTTMLHRFQSNAPRARCNLSVYAQLSASAHFNLMHPMRGATVSITRNKGDIGISI